MHDPVVVREILGAFWKIHILHHAAEGAIAGNWMLKELREHGYDISPGTLYPMLRRLAERGWLEEDVAAAGARRIRLYRITDEGRAVLRLVRQQLRELQSEVLVRQKPDSIRNRAEKS